MSGLLESGLKLGLLGSGLLESGLKSGLLGSGLLESGLKSGLLQSILLSVFLSGLLFFGVGIAPVGINGQPEYHYLFQYWH